MDEIYDAMHNLALALGVEDQGDDETKIVLVALE